MTVRHAVTIAVITPVIMALEAGGVRAAQQPSALESLEAVPAVRKSPRRFGQRLQYYPSTLEQIDEVAIDLARQIRTQYTLAYTPSNQSLDGSFRKIKVEARGATRLVVLTRPGYRATADAAGRPGGFW